MDVKITPPSRCLSCGLKTKNMDESQDAAWLFINLNIPGVVLFSCPKCHAVYTNTDALSNLKEIKEQKEKKVIPVNHMPHNLKVVNN